MANEQKQRTASERIEDLEKAVMSGFQVTNNMARDLMVIKDALKLMGNKVTSMMQASVAGEPLTPEVVSKYMIANNITELKGKVDALVNQGILVPGDVVKDNTFLVGSENEKEGKVVHPRIQFTYGSIEKELQEKLKDAKVGDIVTFKEDKLRFVVNEIYNIVPPKAPEAQVAPAAPAPSANAPATPSTDANAPAPAARAAEQSLSDTPAADQSGQSAGN